MDTIIYLYHSREPEAFITEKWQEREYCLIRLGIPSLLWQNLKQLEKCIIESVEKARHKDAWRKRFGRRKRKYKRQMIEPTPEMEQAKEMESQLRPLLEEVWDLQTALCLLGDCSNRTYCVYEDFVWERLDTKIWQECWKIPQYEGFYGTMWVEELMQYATNDHFLILGYAPCLAQVLRGHGVRMRSVKWFLRPEHYTQAVQEFIEDFYEEYGLAIEMHLLEADEEWIRVRPASVVPVNVLDFSHEEKLSACDVAKGSVWLDMDSLEGKEWRMENRNPQIAYFSMKKQWKQRQKAPSYLDTIHKNRYNT